MAQYFSLHPQNPERRLIRQAVAILRGGGVIAYPTDSSYALGCQIGNTDALRRLRAIRGVDERHQLTLVCRELTEVGRFARLDNRQFRIVKHATPGPFTFVLPATREVPRRLQHPRRSTIGVRVPAHPVALALLEELDEPLLSSTLILPGQSAPLNDPEQIREQLEHQVALVMDAGPCPAEPTTIVDLALGEPVIIRLGRGDPALIGLAQPVSPD